MSHDAFISYSNKDKLVADAVVDHLERAGIKCWTAPRDIMPGAKYGASIMQAINECKVMVVVFSSTANTSDFVPLEVERAVSRSLTIVPIRIENVRPTGDLEFFLSSSQWVEAISPPIERHLDELATKLRILLSLPPRDTVELRKQEPIRPPRETVTTSRMRFSRGKIAAFAILSGILAIALFSYQASVQHALQVHRQIQAERRHSIESRITDLQASVDDITAKSDDWRSSVRSYMKRHRSVVIALVSGVAGGGTELDHSNVFYDDAKEICGFLEDQNYNVGLRLGAAWYASANKDEVSTVASDLDKDSAAQADYIKQMNDLKRNIADEQAKIDDLKKD